ncbi:hypothetical protein ACN28E_43960 [Archangium lansingense]|uniref:hypothetical protein n=1 Tax=Archangium lansingense TaxID=2995310 RepID=UPI003B7A7F0D
MEPIVEPIIPTSEYVRLLIGGLAALASGLSSWKASQRSIAVTFLMFVASTTLAGLLLRERFPMMAGMPNHEYLGPLWWSLAVASVLPMPLLSLAGVVSWARRARPRARNYVGGLLLVVLYVAMARKAMSTALFSALSPQELTLGLFPLALAMLSWQASRRWIPVTLLLLLAGMGGVWLTATMSCSGDMVINGAFTSYSSAPFGCGPLMPFVLPLPVLSMVGLGQWVMRRRQGGQPHPEQEATTSSV